MAGVRCLILHASIYFLRFEYLLAVGKSNAHALANRVIILALKRKKSARKDSIRSSIEFAALLLANDNSKFRHAVVAASEQQRTRLTNCLKKTPKRLPNRELRNREHLTEAEVERLIKANKENRHSHRDATMILVAYRARPTGFRSGRPEIDLIPT